MKTEALSLITNYGPLSTSKIHELLVAKFDMVTDRRELFELLNTEAKRHTLIRSTGSNIGEGIYEGELCFYWSMSE